MSGSSDILQYIPKVEDVAPPPPPPPSKPSEKNSEPTLEMDFSTPISEVMPSASFDPMADASSPTYNSPTTQRVTGVSPGMIGAPPPKNQGGYPLGLTAEQFSAAIAGLSAAIAYSAPVQEKLAEMIPKFLSDAGSLTTTGMAITAALVAVLFFFAMRFLKNQK
jgi:hypothetical protein